MSEGERRRWDQRYREGFGVGRSTASPFLEEWVSRMPATGRALDIACGTGRNALLLASVGFRVEAIDISEVAMELGRESAAERGLQVSWLAADLDAWVPRPEAHDLIIVFRYRNPGLWPRLVEALAPDGWLVVEHHLATGREVTGPTDPAFRLHPQELLRAFGSLRVLHYSETVEGAGEGDQVIPSAIARFVGCKGDPGY